MQKLRQLIDRFLIHCVESRSYSEATADAYCGDLHSFVRCLERAELPDDPAKLKPAHIIGFLDSLAGCRTSTKRRKLYCLSSFFAFLQQPGVVATNPVH